MNYGGIFFVLAFSLLSLLILFGASIARFVYTSIIAVCILLLFRGGCHNTKGVL